MITVEAKHVGHDVHCTDRLISLLIEYFDSVSEESVSEELFELS